jgi:hypothetical protein
MSAITIFQQVELLAEQTEPDENENEHKKKHDHDHPQLAERLPSKTWHAQIIVEGCNERNGNSSPTIIQRALEVLVMRPALEHRLFTLADSQ